MSLPPVFLTAEEYFEAACQFFRRYQFLCANPNTDVLVNNVFDAIDLEGVEDGDVCEHGLRTLATRNRFLNEFYTSARKITVSYKEHEKDEMLELFGITNAPLGPQKKHEVLYLAKEIKQCCEQVGCSTVVDFGSGLGYLDQRVYETTSYNVLGLERNCGHYVTAKKRQHKYHENSLEHVKYVKYTVSGVAQCARDVQGFVADKFGKQPYCITGLHSCADLTIDALNIFLKNADAQALVLMPCCYHNMQEMGGHYPNFPLSSSMRSVFERLSCWEVMAGPFLRLAAQPASVDQSLQHLVFNLLARAVLQLYAHAHNCKIKRNKRKAVKTKDMDQKFEKYIESAVYGFSLVSNAPACVGCIGFRQFDLQELSHIWQQITSSTTPKKAGIFVLLQQAVQEVAENLILFDRLMFLRERGIENCVFKKIFNEKISPKALALVAFK